MIVQEDVINQLFHSYYNLLTVILTKDYMIFTYVYRTHARYL